MRGANRNKQVAYYANFIKEEELLDDDGFMTGEKTRTYTDPIKFRANIGTPRGSFHDLAFGRIENGDRTIADVEMSLPFTIDTIIWIDNKTTQQADYKVVGDITSLNTRRFLIRKQNVNE